MTPPLEQYRELLVRYHAMIRAELWWEDDRRERLVREMDAVWGRMNAGERQYAVEVIAQGLYEKESQS